tara:strand:- start:276 stop:443 length:168 start_codon:yes stop_codon:yes gene_type:complete
MSKLYNEYLAPKLDKAAEKIPGYKKVKEFKNKIVPKGLKFKVGKDKIGISYSKKF